ncbi:hypothetical protein BH24CHL7_BH24CHL7_04480 [soil metagenome]
MTWPSHSPPRSSPCSEATAQRNAGHGIQPVGERMTTGEYLDLWLATSVRPRLREHC